MTDDQPIDEGVTRRELMQAGAVAGGTMLLSSSVIPGTAGAQAEAEEDDVFHEVAVISGLEAERDRIDLALDDDGEERNLLYEAVDTGNRYVALAGADNPGWQPLSAFRKTQLGEAITEQYISQFNLIFNVPDGEAPSTLRWDWTTVTHDSPEVILTGSNSMHTIERGNYGAGSQAVPGLAFRFTGTPGASESGSGGYFTDNNGFGAGEDATDSYVFVRKNGTETKVHRSDWNGYQPDSRVWTSDTPIITRFPHLYYGGGQIGIDAVISVDGEKSIKRLHTFEPGDVSASGPPTDQPNLPIKVETTSLTPELRVNAAHYEKGEKEVDFRLNGVRNSVTGIGTSNWVPVVSWRKRSGWDGINVRPVKISVQSNNDAEIMLVVDSSLTGASFSLAPFTSSSESAVNYDTAATSMSQSQGERRWVGQVSGGSGNRAGVNVADELDFNLPSAQNVTLAARGDSTGTDIKAVVMNGEEF